MADESTEQRPRRRKPLAWMRSGQRVRYFPIAGRPESYVGVIDGDAFRLCSGQWVAHVRDVEGYSHTRIAAASIDHLERA